MTLHSSVLAFLNKFVDNPEIIDHLLDNISKKYDSEFRRQMTNLAERYSEIEQKAHSDAMSGQWPIIFPPACLDDFSLLVMQEGVKMPNINELKTTIYFDKDDRIQVGYELDGVALDKKGYTAEQASGIRAYLDACYLKYLQDKGVELKDGKFYMGDKLINSQEFIEKYFKGSEKAYRAVSSHCEMDIRDSSLNTLQRISKEETQNTSSTQMER